MSLFDRLKSSMAPKEKHSGGIFVDFEIITSHVEGIEHEGFEIPRGGVIKAFQILNFYGEPPPLGTEILLKVKDEAWMNGLISNSEKVIEDHVIRREEDIGGDMRWSTEELQVPVKVESLRRKDGLYQVETSPNITFDMSDMFDLNNFDNAFYALDEMLLTSVDLYRDDPKFFNFSRSEF